MTISYGRVQKRDENLTDKQHGTNKRNIIGFLMHSLFRRSIKEYAALSS